MRSRPGTVVAAVLLLGLVACSSGPLLQSQPVGPNQKFPVCGTSYYLPKKLVTIDLWEVRGARMIQAVDPATGRPRHTAEGSPIYEAREVTHHFGVLGDEKIVPDHRHHYAIQRMESAASDEVVNISLTADGLLTNVKGTVTDRSGDAVKSLAHLFSLVIRGSMGFRGFPGGRFRALDASEDPRIIARYEFDPIDPQDVARVRGALAGHGVTLEIEKQSNCPTATSGADCDTTCDSTSPGIYYRLPIPYRLTIHPAGVMESNRIQALEAAVDRTYLLPNEAICKYVPVTRASFVRKDTELQFDQGMLTKVVTNKPSELVGFVTIPVDVATTIVGIPAELLKFRLETTNLDRQITSEERDQVRAERDRIESLTRLMEAMKKYEELQGTLDE
jgi:hypothetical protein